MALRFLNAKPYYDTEPVRDIVRSALAYPNDEMLDRLLSRYHDDDDMRLIAAIDDEDNLLGIIGLKIDDVGAATVLHLRVHDTSQRRGIGSALIRKVIALLGLRRLSSRSPENLLPFYASLGFTNWVVGEKPRGHKWYGVRWEAAAMVNGKEKEEGREMRDER
jgi:GNAT superfamily N-acetyltransferase